MAEYRSRNPRSSKDEPLSGGSAKHILIVDDDPSMREMMSSYLRGQNFRVSAVADGQGMSRTLRDKPVDLIILDMKLADEDGLDLMRSLGNPPRAPIIIVTGH